MSAEWVDDGFTSLRLTVPEEGAYRIRYSAVNNSNGNIFCTPRAREAVAHSLSEATIDDLSSHCFYVIVVKDVSVDFMNPPNENVGVGEYMYIIIPSQCIIYC